MKNKKLRIASAVAVTIMLANNLIVSAKFESYNDPDGFTLGHYETEINSSARAETEQLYSQRPKNERQFEYLTRGLTAVPGENGTLISWRFLGTDSNSLAYNLYCGGEKLNSEPIATTNFFHTGAPAGAEYTLKEVENGIETGAEYKTKAWDKNYISFKVTEREGYNIDDGTVADLDGDGEYEIILRRTPSMDVKTRTSYPLIEAYEMNGEHMWTIDIGPNEINEVDINILAYDMNGDGKAEVILRSFEGTTDGAGNTIGDTNGDGIIDYSKDENNIASFPDRQYIISTPEFISMYNGETGAEMDRTDLKPAKEPLSDWSYNYTDTNRLTKRASHYLFGLAYLDGVTPSVVVVRGAWDNVRAAAWHIEDGKFTEDWVHNTENKEDVNSIWGACNHNLVTVDVDFDGKDEILSGPMAIDHDGSEMYAVKAYDNDGAAQKLGHGDAFDVAKMEPDFNGYTVWACHENAPLITNIELHDARTGEITWGYSKNKDTGRSRAADIDPTQRGFEVWGSTGTIPANVSGENLSDSWNKFLIRNTDGTIGSETSVPMNFKVYWDGDLLSELLDGTTISKYNWEDKAIDVLMNADGCASNAGTKAVPCVSADLFGDWREEVIWKTADEKEIRIYSTSIPTSYKLNTLMHDSYYRASVAVQNNHYNQPPNVSYYLGSETTEIPIFEGYVEKEGDATVSFPDGKMRLENNLDPSLGQASNYVYWCDKKLPDSVIIEWSFKPLNDDGLAIMFFSADGQNGKDLFDPSLAKRDGQYKLYHSGDINAFHVSYYRHSTDEESCFHVCNLRKSAGFQMVAQGADPLPPAEDVIEPYRIKVIKDKEIVRFYITDPATGIELMPFEFTDNEELYGDYLEGGYIGFRQKAPLIGEYSDLKVYEAIRKES